MRNFSSFQRLLNLHGFRRSSATARDAYFHPKFLQHQREIAKLISRTVHLPDTTDDGKVIVVMKAGILFRFLFISFFFCFILFTIYFQILMTSIVYCPLTFKVNLSCVNFNLFYDRLLFPFILPILFAFWCFLQKIFNLLLNNFVSFFFLISSYDLFAYDIVFYFFASLLFQFIFISNFIFIRLIILIITIVIFSVFSFLFIRIMILFRFRFKYIYFLLYCDEIFNFSRIE